MRSQPTLGRMRLAVLCLRDRSTGHTARDRAGTEAAAATIVVVEVESEPIVVSIDRPFVFLIRDIETSSILFIGRILDPST